MISLKKQCILAVLSLALVAADPKTEPSAEHPFQIDALGDVTFTFTPAARGEMEAFVQLDQRECYINLIVKTPSGRAKNSRRLGYTRFRTVISITSDDLNQPWTARIKNYCEMKPVSGVLRLYFPSAPEVSPSSVPSPPPASAEKPVSPAPPAVSPGPQPSAPAIQEARLDAGTRSIDGFASLLQSATLSFDGVALSAESADRDREKQGWVLLGSTEGASATITLSFSGDGWIAVFADFNAPATTELRLSSEVAPSESSALVLSPPSQSFAGDATVPTWVKGTPGAVVKLTFSASRTWIRGVRLQPAVAPPSTPAK
jgi:hypothetical protein